MATVIQVEQALRTSDDVTSMVTTFQVQDDIGLVMVPLNIFTAKPTTVCDAFRRKKRTITHNPNWVNVFVDNDVIFPSDFGKMDKLTQTWTINGKTEEFLDGIINKLSTRTTVMSLTLHRSKITSKDTDINFLVFVKPSSPSMASLIDSLCLVKTNFHGSKKFAVELDLGPTVEKWARDALGQDMTCIGGRLGITNGGLFNPLFRWNVAVGFVPLIPVTVMASLAYRASRKVKYEEKRLKPNEVICLLGSKSSAIEDQREAMLDLTRIAVAMSVEKCLQCELVLLPEDKSSPCCTCPDYGIWKSTSKEDRGSSAEDSEKPEISEEDRQRIKEFTLMTSLSRVETVTLGDSHRNSISMDSNPRMSISHIEVELNPSASISMEDLSKHGSLRRVSLLGKARRGSVDFNTLNSEGFTSYQKSLAQAARIYGGSQGSVNSRARRSSVISDRRGSLTSGPRASVSSGRKGSLPSGSRESVISNRKGSIPSGRRGSVLLETNGSANTSARNSISHIHLVVQNEGKITPVE